MLDLEPYVNFLIKHKLTQRQFLFLVSIMTNRKDLIEKYKRVFPYNPDIHPSEQRMLSQYETDELIKQGYLIFDNGSYYITNVFIKNFGDSDYLVKSLVNAYPKFIDSGGKMFPLTAISEEKIKSTYCKFILNSLDEHREVIKDIEYGKENGLISISLEKFIDSRFWKTIREKRIERSSPVKKEDVENIRNLNVE